MPAAAALPAFSDYRSLIHYGRFSSPQQAAGVSEERQADRVDEWTSAHGLAITSRVVDRGLSGFHGRHRTQGGFGAILQAAEAGAIERPALLLLAEGDRAGREDTDVQLQSLVLGLLRNGIDLLVVDSGLHLNLERFNTDLGAQIQLLAMLHGANSYSRRLSARMLDAHQRGREKITAGEPARIGWRPHWIDWVDGKWQLNHHAATVRRLLELAEADGAALIASTLNREGHVTANGRRWTPGTVQHILASPAVCGGRPTRRREEDAIAWGYWPAVITREEWEALRVRRENRRPGTRQGGGDQRSLLYIGQMITTCASCGRAVGQRFNCFTAADGTRQTRRYVRCRGARIGACDQPSLPLPIVTAAILTRLQGGQLAGLFPAQAAGRMAELQGAIESARRMAEQQQAMAAAGERQIGKLLADGGADAVGVIARQVAAAERAARDAERRMLGLQGELAAAAREDQQQAAGELQGKVRELLAAFARGEDTPEQRRAVNGLLRRLDVRITVDAAGERMALAVGDGEPVWQPLAPRLAAAALGQGLAGVAYLRRQEDAEGLAAGSAAALAIEAAEGLVEGLYRVSEDGAAYLEA
jgi:hypothetical protein